MVRIIPNRPPSENRFLSDGLPYIQKHTFKCQSTRLPSHLTFQTRHRPSENTNKAEVWMHHENGIIQTGSINSKQAV
ncbi:MAG: hypothetical protein ACFNKE_11205 [Neisseria elongata]